MVLLFIPLIAASIGAALVYAAITAAGLISTYFQNKKDDERIKQQQDWQESMMDKQNEYNLPVNQVEREQAAGIYRNTNAMANGSLIGGSSVGVGGSGLLPASNPLLGGANGLLSFMQAHNQNQDALDKQTLREARLKEVQATIDNLKANSEMLGINTEGQRIINQYIAAEKTWAIKNQKAQFDLTLAERSRLNKEVDKLAFEINSLLPAEKQLKESENRKVLLDLDYTTALISSIKSDVKKTEAETGLIEAQSENERLRSEQIQAETSLTDEQVIQSRQTLEKILDKYDAEIQNIKAQYHLTEEEAYWYVIKLQSETLSSKDVINRSRLGKRIFNLSNQRVSSASK